MIKTNTGYFDKLNNEYVITNMKPIRPLKNFLFNEKMIGSYDQFGFGLSQGQTPSGFRNLLMDYRLIYIKEGESYYCANRNFTDLPFDIFECHVGVGYQKIVSQYQGIQVELNIVIPRQDYCEINHVVVKNTTDRTREIKLVYVNKPFVNLTWHTAYTYADYNKENNALVFSHLGYDVDEKNNIVLIKPSLNIDSFDVSEINFKGIYNSLSDPKALKNEHLSNTPITFDYENAGCMMFNLVIGPKEKKSINVVSCFGESFNEANEVASKYIDEKSYVEEMRQLKQQNDNQRAHFEVETPDEYLNIMMNTFLKRQIDLGKTWGRVYGKGFRDVMQDTASFTALDPLKAKEKIINTLKYQFENGNTIRQFDPVLDYPYQDGASWICYALLTYLKETNDLSILSIDVNYYQSDKKESVFLHAKKGIDYLLNNLGNHNLVLWGGGDWNDSLNNCGMKGIGESVWLSMATIKATREFLYITERTSLQVNREYYLNKIDILNDAIMKYGFEEDQFIYGFNDYGKKIGSKYEKEGSIFLNPQTWAVLANVGSIKEQNKVMNNVEEKLKCSFGYMQLAPSFSKGDDNIGRASYFLPGTYENGSVYNHGVAFKIAADYALNRNDNAYETLKMISPIYNQNSGMEPYAYGNMYLGPECISRVGFSPMPWITGTAGWIYKNVQELLLGIIPDYDGIIINPKLPSHWNKVKIKRIYQNIIFDICIEKTGKERLIVDNEIINGNKIRAINKKYVKVLYEY